MEDEHDPESNLSDYPIPEEPGGCPPLFPLDPVIRKFFLSRVANGFPYEQRRARKRIFELCAKDSRTSDEEQEIELLRTALSTPPEGPSQG